MDGTWCFSCAAGYTKLVTPHRHLTKQFPETYGTMTHADTPDTRRTAQVQARALQFFYMYYVRYPLER